MGADDLAGRRLGGFELIELIGAGSYGSVWRAHQVRLDREVAVKVLDPLVARDPNAARRFEREGRAAASLDHPAVIPVFEAGDSDGLYYLAMRLVDGETLAEVIDRDAPMPRQRVAELLRPIAAALDAAHATGLYHRDVKPSNIMIERGRPYLGDFGIAASARELGRYTTGSIGTAEYMAPEQARGDEVDHRADLYALGCVAFHALSGRSPFARDTMLATLLAHSTDDIPSTGDDDLDAFFAVALAKEPEERHQSGAAFIDALDDGSANAATLRSAVEVEGRTNRSRTWGLVAAGCAVLALVVGAVVVAGRGSGDETAEPSATTVVAGEGTDGSSSAQPEAVAPSATDDIDIDPAPDADVIDAPDLGIEVSDGGTVQVGTTLDLTDPNPHSSLDTARVLAEWVLPVMYRIDERLDPVPSLAVGPPLANEDDPLSLTWTIRDDQVWEDGSRVTAADIETTFRYLAADGTNAASTLLYDSVESVMAVDDTNLSIRLREPNGAAYLMFSTIHPIIKAAAWDEHEADGGTAADFLDAGWNFSAGPFQLATRQNPGEVSLVPNPAWVGERQPSLERVQIATYRDPTSLVVARERGELDVIWVQQVDTDEINDAAAVEDTETLVGSSNVAVQLSFNHRSPSLADIRVRNAIALAIDRQAIASFVVGNKTREAATTWDSMVFAPSQSGNEAAFDVQPDPAEGNRLLDETVWQRPDDTVYRRDFGPNEDLALDLVYVDGPEPNNVVADVIRDLQDIGVLVNPIGGSAEETTARFEAGEFDLLLQFRVFNNDPVATDLVFGTSGCPVGVGECTGSGVNFGAFSDAEVDTLLAQADSVTDLGERLDLYTAVDRRLVEQFAAIPLYVRPAFTAHDSSLVGIQMAPNIGPLTSLADWGYIQD